MISAALRIPNFAGVALVDILANGVAVLIIVIVLSIAARSEQESRYAEQVKEVSTVMAREFSTSLVLNRLAAGPRAELHDYENSPIDQFWDPYLLPIIEFHQDVIRDPYSGRVWPRSELLQEPNSFDTWIENLTLEQRQYLRGDFYDVGTFYLAMAILRDYGIQINHWHFIGARAGGLAAGNCPPGVSAKDCDGAVAGGGRASQREELFALLQNPTGNAEGTGERVAPSDPFGAYSNSGSATSPGSSRRQLPSDVLLDGGSTANRATTGRGDSSRWGSFPDANAERRGQRGNSQGANASSEQTRSISIRSADPDALDATEGGIALALGDLEPTTFLSVLMIYMDAVQEALNAGHPPTRLIRNMQSALGELLTNPPELPAEHAVVVEDLATNLALNAEFGTNTRVREPLNVIHNAHERLDAAAVRVLANRVLVDAEVLGLDATDAAALPSQATAQVSLNKFPDIWKGLQLTLEKGSVLMVPPTSGVIQTPSWRIVTYVSPSVDDFVLGFVNSTIDDNGYLTIFGEPNRAKIGSISLLNPFETDLFGVKTWLLMCYALLGTGLIGLLLLWRPGVRTP